ncbi:MAG: flagellar basal body rod protein FlgB [Halioglobus sp.]|nr:flagellar basal body rod protein FlgB [Halioglobus sp.]
MNMIDKAFGASPQVLMLRAERFELISANLANADTPGYKARDLDFASALSRARETTPRQTHARHMALSDESGAIMYRTPAQLTLDGNTVETDQEHAAFMDNAIRYQASLNFLNGRIKSVLSALRGE